MRELDQAFGDQLTSYARRMVADSAKVSKEELLVGLTLETEIYAPLGELLDTYDALICPTMAIPGLNAEYDTGGPLKVNGQPVRDWYDVLMTVPFSIAKTYDDVTAFRVAAAHEERLPWLTESGPRPPL